MALCRQQTKRRIWSEANSRGDCLVRFMGVFKNDDGHNVSMVIGIEPWMLGDFWRTPGPTQSCRAIEEEYCST
ncbi:hypothetical protein TNCV_3407391 [Trichonephila clavipes]|nr:hypothetical protein TNCV_3407391 [Trichonephila clavipes]